MKKKKNAQAPPLVRVEPATSNKCKTCVFALSLSQIERKDTQNIFEREIKNVMISDLSILWNRVTRRVPSAYWDDKPLTGELFFGLLGEICMLQTIVAEQQKQLSKLSQNV